MGTGGGGVVGAEGKNTAKGLGKQYGAIPVQVVCVRREAGRSCGIARVFSRNQLALP